MNHDEVKRKLLEDPEVREMYRNPPLPLAVARAVVQRRRALGLSQEELAARLGTSQMQVWRIESGQANITLDTLQKLSEVLELSVDLRAPATPTRA
jgi:transcriptional regulator with XRE-family HTH domain